MIKSSKVLACLLLAVFLLALPLDGVQGAALTPLAAGTFPAGTIVVPMDNKQADRIRVYGLIHEFLRLTPGGEVVRVIEPPDVTLQTSLTPTGAVYQGGPFLIDQKFLTAVNNLLATSFSRVTVTRLTAPFTSNNLFFVRQPTRILLIQGVFGETYVTLNEMGLNYTSRIPDFVLDNPSIINNYTLIIVDCPGWFGNPTTYIPDTRAKIQAVYQTLATHVQAGSEVIFTDIALKDLNANFPGYVNLLGPNQGGNWNATVHNPPIPSSKFSPEFPSQYYNTPPNPTVITVPTYGSGYAVSSVQPAHANDVRIILDSNQFGIPYQYAILGFYFQYGNGIVEGLTYDRDLGIVPVILGSPSFYAVEQIYGNKFVHGPQVDFFITATDKVTVPQGKTANYTVTVTSVGGFNSAVKLGVSGLDSTMTPSWTQDTVTPPPGGSISTTLRISTTLSTPNKIYPLTISGTSSLPAIMRTYDVTLNVTLAKSDFAVAVDPKPPNFLIVNQTQCRNATVTGRSIGNFSSPVNMTLTGLPASAHVTYQYLKNPITPPVGGSTNAILKICAGPDAPPGNYTLLLVRGTEVTTRVSPPPISHSTPLNLRVQKSGVPPFPWWIIPLLLLALALALLAAFLSQKRAPPPRPLVVPVGQVRRRPRVLRVLPLPMVRCRYCGRIMPLYAIYCPYCGRPQVVLARPQPRMVGRAGVVRTTRKSIVAFALSLVAGILVILNSAALLAPGFYGPPVNWSGIFFWLGALGPVYAFALGVIIGLVLIMGSVVMVLRHGALADIIIFPFAIFSLIIGGGFVAGMVLGIVGGIIGALKR